MPDCSFVARLWKGRVVCRVQARGPGVDAIARRPIRIARHQDFLHPSILCRSARFCDIADLRLEFYQIRISYRRL